MIINNVIYLHSFTKGRSNLMNEGYRVYCILRLGFTGAFEQINIYL